jgi:hypothetical protein
MNTVYSIEEYIAQGFTAEEAPIARKTDIMYNRFNELTPEEKEKYFAMCAWLGL